MRYINKQRFVKANHTNSTEVTNGVDGQDGKSAYEIWLDLGNVGTEADFINSLTGPQGIQGQAGSDGIDGTNGINGLDGKSAYQIWLDSGNIGTEQDFLSSITGPQGVDGTNGVDGQDGKSAYEIWLDLGNTGTETDFINSIGGQGGTTGSNSGDIQLTNRSSQVLEPGDIVILDKNNPLSVTTTNLYYSPDVIGVVKTGGGVGQLVTVQTSGVVDIKMTVLPVNIGDNIYIRVMCMEEATLQQPHGLTFLVKH